MVLSPIIWSFAKLRHVDIKTCSVYDSDIDKPTKLENLTTTMLLNLSCSVDSGDIFKRFLNLRTLDFFMDCSAAEQIYFPRLDVLNKLERDYALFQCSGRHTHVHQFDFHFPSSLKEVEMDGLKNWDITTQPSKAATLGSKHRRGKRVENGTSHLPQSQISTLCGCPQLKESALKNKEYVEEITGEDKLENKTIAFIGDSLGRQQFQSLMCMAAGGT
ncbi:hypothetical protein CQW23_32377 [Capsicum baccatum]|uniref:Trichome birefringence-like C-terminal domain-containing protein n=1 Tax=Capsicum baccatum TaxID=33114 RepID=A0A2G2V4U9_CAPBA|nr:hypothetical protein CQW23_32377 [Capsicum baccatum]